MEVKTIDYVVPMVFHQDKEWRKNFEEVGSWYDEGDLNGFVRYRSWNTEHLLVRCVKRFMPWIRTIYVILAQESQKQPWMEEEGVRIVYHKEIIPRRYLPTFNSQTIEMYLKDIPDLSERFIYGNDDIFPLSPLEETDFFQDGLPCLHYTEHAFDKTSLFHCCCNNGLNFAAKEFERHYDDTIIKCGHGLTPMLKSTWKHLWEIGKKEIEQSISPFREKKNFNQWICPWWHYVAGKYADMMPNTVFVSTKEALPEILEAIFSESTQVVCINDNECLEDYQTYKKVIKRAIKKIMEDD